MKEVWECTWETIPGHGEQTEMFSTLAAAKLAMRQKIAESVDLTEYLADLEQQTAAFLGKYLSDPQFPQSKSQIPEEYEDPEDGMLFIDSDYIRWEHPYGAYPKFNTNLVLDDEDGEEYTFNFWYELPRRAAGKGVNELSIKIVPRTDYGTSAYPLMVLMALYEEPATQDQIAGRIRERWDTVIDRKAIGRHLELLKTLGYPVQHGPEGYCWNGEKTAPQAGASYSPSAYPLLVLQVLSGIPKSQTAIMREIQETFGVKIDRKAVSRHLELLQALNFRAEKCKDGYYLSK